jgi:hypothetical protein
MSLQNLAKLGKFDSRSFEGQNFKGENKEYHPWEKPAASN